MAEPTRQFLPSTSAHFGISEYHRRGLQTLINSNSVTDADQEQHEAGNSMPSKSNDSSAVKLSATSNLKTSARHDLAMIFTCKVCETRSVKTACRESYEKGVVVARCGGCNNLHLIADHLGWFGEPGSIEDFLAARGEEVKKGSVDTLNLTLEDLAGRELSTCDLISSVQSQRNSRSTFFVSLCWQITRTSKAKLRNMTTAACCFRSTSLPSSFSIHKKLAVKRNSNAVSFMGLLSFSPKTSSFSTGLISISLKQRRSKNSFQVRAVVAPSEAVSGFDEMVAGTQRKYYMLGGKGGVGKTSCAASLAVKFANNGHPTLVVSTDPAHSLSDSFAQDLTGGQLVPVEGPDFPLFALEINPEKAREEFRNVTQKDGGTGVKDFMDGMGLGMLVEQLGELKLGELLDTPPPGLDEAIAISKGHTLRLLSLPDFLDASIGKILKSDKLERLRERMVKVRELFRDTDSTEFVIVTIPTVMAVSESSRLSESLKKENVPVKRLIVNQIIPPSASDCKFCAMKRKDQMRALEMIKSDSELSSLMLIEAPLVDVEIRGVPALRFMGDIIWK
ncbi:hypothetical protein CUMW_178850 [Citrus unshiu]|nr:hypothetical protein CUMW_178850 [Citrus unshiu]GAY57366.1 hypothetical protein CUMW_178850 [Citrus unshiu]